MTENMIRTMESIEDYLINRSNHNTVSKNLSCSTSEGYLCEILTDSRTYFMKVRLDKGIEYVILEMYPGITVEPNHYEKAAKFCMETTDNMKVGGLRIQNKRGGVYFHIAAPVKDAPVTGELLEEMESIAIVSLKAHEHELECLARGIEEKNERMFEQMIKDLLEKRKRLGAGDESEDVDVSDAGEEDE